MKLPSMKWQRLFAATIAVTLAPVTALAEDHDRDDANARREFRDQWYNESYGSKATKKAKKGGPWSREFQKFMNDAAAKERAKYAAQLPGTSTTITAVTDPNASIAATGTTWVNIGPNKANYAQNGSYNLNKTDAGRVRNILIDPTNANTLYAAFAGGGVWKSTDGGATWAPKTETLGSLSVGSLEMDPNNSQTLYLGLGDPFDGTGVGLVKSIDGGNTWFAPVYLGNSTSITDIQVVPGNSSIVLATTNTGIFRSVDAGATWSAVSLSTGFAEAPSAWSIGWAGGTKFIATLEAEPSYTSGNTQGQVWVTADNGATWTRATGVTSTAGLERMTVAVAPSNRNTVYVLASNPSGQLADIYKSTNGGTSFTALGAAAKRYSNGNTEARNVSALFNGQGWYDQMIVVHPTNANLVYFGGALHMAKTTDGGSTFSQVSNWLGQFSLPYVHADFHTATFDATGTKLYVGNDGGLFVTADGGATFSDSLNVGIASHLIYDIGSSAGDRSAVIAGLQDNGTRVRVGSTSVYNQEIGGDGFDCEIHPDGKTMLGTLYYTRIYKSTDGGLNFASASTGITESNNSSSAPFNTVLARWDGDATGNTVYTYSNAKVYKSTNYATSWTALGVTGLPTGLVIRGIGTAKSNGSIVGIVASGGRVFLTNNGGTSWTQAGVLPNNGLSTSSIAFDPTNPNTLYVTSVAPDATKAHTWKSTDFGATFTAIENGLPAGVPVNQISVDPGSSSTLYAATHLGVYRSTDAGASWSRFGTGMPLVNVTDIEILPDSSLVRAATFGRSVWELTP
ncbi:WD40/YVTN/BNR-like repeat-containing protein [Archangium sp.]|uniref:WD40/YVTN/BNR-like repeat-containing protein n=1 Tax=Archangium sp. TaxID=1872627 RepID=UPI002ED9A838